MGEKVPHYATTTNQPNSIAQDNHVKNPSIPLTYRATVRNRTFEEKVMVPPGIAKDPKKLTSWIFARAVGTAFSHGTEIYGRPLTVNLVNSSGEIIDYERLFGEYLTHKLTKDL